MVSLTPAILANEGDYHNINGDDDDNFSGRRWDGITDGCQTSLSSDLPLIKFQPSRPVASHIGTAHRGERVRFTCKYLLLNILSSSIFDGISFCSAVVNQLITVCSWERSLGFRGFLPAPCLRWRAVDCMYWSNALRYKNTQIHKHKYILAKQANF